MIAKNYRKLLSIKDMLSELNELEITKDFSIFSIRLEKKNRQSEVINYQRIKNFSSLQMET